MTSTSEQDRQRRAALALWNPIAAEAGPARGRALAAARRRGGIQGGVGLVAALLLWRIWSPWAGGLAAGFATLVLCLALASPGRGFPALEGAVGRFATWVGLAVTWTLMVPVFYLIFLPLGMLLRAAGKLRITRRPDPGLASYWQAPEAREPGLERYRRQF